MILGQVMQSRVWLSRKNAKEKFICLGTGSCTQSEQVPVHVHVWIKHSQCQAPSMGREVTRPKFPSNKNYPIYSILWQHSHGSGYYHISNISERCLLIIYNRPIGERNQQVTNQPNIFMNLKEIVWPWTRVSISSLWTIHHKEKTYSTVVSYRVVQTM